jgi:alpha-beta hydrolase superfamily lysophospholipase
MAVSVKEDSFAGTGGKIAYRSWLPDGAPRAVLVLCPGFNSHSGQYDWPARQFAAKGLAVYAVDLRGRGKSDGTPRFYVDSMSEYVTDLSGLIKLAKSRHPGLKTFLLGHSAGGATSVAYALDNQSELAGLICESFAYRVPAPDFVLKLFTWVAPILPKAGVLKLNFKDFSRDPQKVAELEADPLTKNETQPLKTIAALQLNAERLHREFSKITLPVLILHGTSDHATVPAGSQEFFDKASSKDKQIKLYPDHFHDLLADIGKEEVIADIQGWLDKRI